MLLLVEREATEGRSRGVGVLYRSEREERGREGTAWCWRSWCWCGCSETRKVGENTGSAEALRLQDLCEKRNNRGCVTTTAVRDGLTQVSRLRGRESCLASRLPQG